MTLAESLKAAYEGIAKTYPGIEDVGSGPFKNDVEAYLCSLAISAKRIADALGQSDRHGMTGSASPEETVTENQIKHMVNRFLMWRLPDPWYPDGGISFKPDFNESTAHPMKHKPTGTNLFDAGQAEAMVRHMVEGMSV